MKQEQEQQAPQENPQNRKPQNNPLQVGKGPCFGSAGVVKSGRGYLTVKEIAQYLNMKTSSVYAWVSEMPHYKIGNLLRFKREDVDAWMETKREGAGVHQTGIRRTRSASDVDNIVRKTIDAAKAKSYNSSGKSDHVKGLQKGGE